MAVLICLCAFAPVAAKGAAISSTKVTELSNAAQKLAAYGGYVVFSQLDAQGRWALMSSEDGTITRLDAPARQIPFDAQVGPGSHGQPTVVFSKCKVDPPGVGGQTGQRRITEWWRGVGCQIYDLVLPGGSAKPIHGIRPPRGFSDTTPAIWDGNVAFARHGSGSRSTHLYVWHQADGATNQVGGGPNSCREATGSGRRCHAPAGHPPA
jgi:hypothetical protein